MSTAETMPEADIAPKARPEDEDIIRQTMLNIAADKRALAEWRRRGETAEERVRELEAKVAALNGDVAVLEDRLRNLDRLDQDRKRELDFYRDKYDELSGAVHAIGAAADRAVSLASAKQPTTEPETKDVRPMQQPRPVRPAERLSRGSATP